MSWFARRAAGDLDDSAATMAFASDFGDAVDRAFAVDAAVLDRVRGRVLQSFVEAGPAAKPGRFERPARRGLALALTASLGLAVVGTAAAEAAPGRPFYPLKLSMESVALPAVDAPTGWVARIDRLGTRIDEALGAEADRDATGIGAALGEYRLELAGLVVAPLDPARQAQLQARAATDLPTVVDLDGAFPSQTAGLLIVDLRALLPAVTPATPASPDAGGSVTGNPHQDGATGNPHADGTTGNPHSDGATGNPHAAGTTGNPHTGGTTSNPHAGTTGNPHADGTTGNPHTGATTGNPHAGGTSGKPHAAGTTGNPHSGTKSGNPHADGGA